MNTKLLFNKNLLLLTLILSSSCFINFENSQKNQGQILSENISKRIMAPLKEIDPIIIRNDTAFIDYTKFLGLSGSGEYLNPFIIANYNITSSGEAGIEIANTSFIFTIENCTITNADSSAGFRLENISFAKVENVSCIDNKNGFELDNIDRSTFRNCQADHNDLNGFLVTNCIDNTFYDIKSSSNGMNGFSVTGGYKNSFTKIYAVPNGLTGFEFSYSIDNRISYSEFGYTTNGIVVDHCNGTLIDNCFLEANLDGIQLNFGERNDITSSYFTVNNFGLIMDHSSHSYIENLTVLSSLENGIDLNYVESCNFTDIYISDAAQCLTSTYSQNNVFDNVSVTDSISGYDIALMDCEKEIFRNCHVYDSDGISSIRGSDLHFDNILSENNEYGFYLFSTNYTTIHNSRVQCNKEYGIYTSGCSFTSIENTTANNNVNYGIYLLGGNYSVVRNCTFIRNGYVGATVNSGNDNLVEGNFIAYNNQSGLGTSNCIRNRIINNVLYKNKHHGLLMFGDPDTTSDNLIADNFIGYNGYSGTSQTNNHGNTFSTNQFIRNHQMGIYSYLCKDNVFYNNFLSDNTLFGLLLDQSVTSIIYANIIINNSCSSSDHSNHWYFNGVGNYWGDGDHIDEDNDGLSEVYYTGILDVGGIDYFPLVPNIIPHCDLFINEGENIDLKWQHLVKYAVPYRIEIDGKVIQSGEAYPDQDISILLNDLSIGDSNITLVIMDFAVEMIDSVIVSVIDNIKPFITAPSFVTLAKGNSSNAFNIYWSAYDIHLTTYLILLNGDIYDFSPSTFESGELQKITISNLNPGVYNLTILANDQSENIGRHTIQLVILEQLISEIAVEVLVYETVYITVFASDFITESDNSNFSSIETSITPSTTPGFEIFLMIACVTIILFIRKKY